MCWVSSLGLTNYVEPEPEGSSPYSQEPTTGPYPEPTESTHPLPSANLLKICSDPIYASVFQVISFLQAFTCTLFSPLQCVPHALHTSFY
jgi:hypothetical protein